MELEQARAVIDRADAAIAAAFADRMRAVAEIAVYKASHGLPILDVTREKQVIEKNAARFDDETLREYYLTLLRTLTDVSKQYQRALFADEGFRDRVAEND